MKFFIQLIAFSQFFTAFIVVNKGNEIN